VGEAGCEAAHTAAVTQREKQQPQKITRSGRSAAYANRGHIWLERPHTFTRQQRQQQQQQQQRQRT
jgi:hypothetical protein